ncbi:hypothetical protein YC2023_081905 [Brassica napus]
MRYDMLMEEREGVCAEVDKLQSDMRIRDIQINEEGCSIYIGHDWNVPKKIVRDDEDKNIRITFKRSEEALVSKGGLLQQITTQKQLHIKKKLSSMDIVTLENDDNEKKIRRN